MHRQFSELYIRHEENFVQIFSGPGGACHFEVSWRLDQISRLLQWLTISVAVAMALYKLPVFALPDPAISNAVP